MRLWSLHPKYLDAKGLVALWRESLLAKHVLEGRTKGYKHHPQLRRFREFEHPLDAINYYLEAILNEADSRGYRFNADKIDRSFALPKLNVTSGQMEFERSHLLNKLRTRDPERFANLILVSVCEPHPIFSVIDGGLEIWEKP